MRKRPRRRRRVRPRKCRHCREWFTPDARTAYRASDASIEDSPVVRHQRFCSAKPCQEASRRHTQFKWRWKSGGYDHQRAKKASSGSAAPRGRRGRHRPPCRHATVTITSTTTASGRQAIRVLSRFRKTGALQDVSFEEQPADAALTLVWRSAPQEPIRLLPHGCYCSRRASERPQRQGGGRPGSMIAGRRRGRTEARKGRNRGWTLLNWLSGNSGQTAGECLLRCLRRWWTSTTRPCCAAAAA